MFTTFRKAALGAALPRPLKELPTAPLERQDALQALAAVVAKWMRALGLA